MQLKDVQEHVMEAASRLTAAIKPEIAKMLMELSAGAANFKDQKEFSLQDIEVSYFGDPGLHVNLYHNFLIGLIFKITSTSKADSALLCACGNAGKKRHFISYVFFWKVLSHLQCLTSNLVEIGI